MEPRIQYTTTSDGVRIAHWAMGRGRPLVVMRWEVVSHLVNELALPEVRGFYERLAEGRTVVRYDRRGCGLSTRVISDWSYDTLVADLVAVIDARGYEQVDLLALGFTAPLGVLFATRHPDRLGRLIVLESWGDRSRLRAFTKALDPLFEEYPHDVYQMYMHLTVGWEHSDFASRAAAAFQHAVSPEFALRT